MGKDLNIVVVEDVADEVELAARQFKRAGMDCHMKRVESESEFTQALRENRPDLIISDFSLPQFDGMSALQIARVETPDIPFIFVSGTIGEERAIEALKHGATDYILKTNLARLVPAVKRALEEAEERRAKRNAEQKLRDLVRIHTMLSSVNSVVLRSRDREELLQEAARIAADKGGYGFVTVFMVEPGKSTLRPFVWKGVHQENREMLGFALPTDSVQGQSLTARAIRAKEPIVCNDLWNETAVLGPNERQFMNTFRAAVALPLIVDATAVGTLNLYSTEPGAFTDDELNLLREVAGSLSFALQYLHKEDKVQFLAYFDPLTSLAQRSLFCERLARQLEARKDSKQPLIVMMVDVERLSTINDRYGRHTGDFLLQLIAERLKDMTQGTDYLAHFGGGRFCVVFPNVDGKDTDDAAQHARERIAQLFDEPFLMEGEEIRTSVRTGAARFPGDEENDGDESAAELLLRNAEMALKSARESGERHLDYVRDMNAGQIKRLTLEHKLRRALDEQQYILYYQPKISTENGRVVGAEALLRWKDPDNGLVAPGVFIPVLEESGLIVDVGKWALEQAIADGARWQQQINTPIPIAVNVSNLQLRRKDFVDTVLRVLKNAPGSVPIDIEITESALMDDFVSGTNKLRLLKEEGISVAIDDFGTGYSSLSQLSKLAVDALKIDRSFIAGLSSDPANMTIVNTIIALARSFDLAAVAEGVETEEQLKLLRLLKCHQIQGYLIAKPMPPEEFGKMLLETGGTMSVRGIN